MSNATTPAISTSPQGLVANVGGGGAIFPG